MLIYIWIIVGQGVADYTNIFIWKDFINITEVNILRLFSYNPKLCLLVIMIKPHAQ